jgi:D-arabinose 1-dehydrogenase-like Zn-dependent alcohol dehydrogenase
VYGALEGITLYDLSESVDVNIVDLYMRKKSFFGALITSLNVMLKCIKFLSHSVIKPSVSFSSSEFESVFIPYF